MDRYCSGMQKACSTCARVDVSSINDALFAASRGDPGAETIGAIARRTGIPKTSLLRHRGHAAGTVEGVHAAERVTPARARVATPTGRPGPGSPCMTCQSPKRVEIERMLCNGAPFAAIAREIPGAPSHDSIRNHAQRCIPDAYRTARAEGSADVVQRIASDLGEVRDLAMSMLRKAHDLVDEANERKDHDATTSRIKDAAAILRAAKDVLQLCGGVTGELRERVDVDITEARRWPVFVESVALSVAGCRECSSRVAEALERLDQA